MLPLAYASWMQGEGKKMANLCEVMSRTSEVHPATVSSFRIVSPMNGTTAYLDPDLPAGGQRFPLKIAGSGEEQVEWASDSLEIETRGEHSWVILKQGTHQVEATDRVSGEKKVTKIVVEVL